jgi:hypothetical protein
VLLQKDSSWWGTLEVLRDGKTLKSDIGSQDFALQLQSPAPGPCTIRVTGSGSGKLSILTSLPELKLGEWTIGSILRCYGSAWYEIHVPASQQMLSVAAETLGLWSRLEVAYGMLGASPIWSATGDNTNMQIPSPAGGTYYVSLTDSAWFPDHDLPRDHQAKADLKPIGLPPPNGPVITGISPARGANTGPVTMMIKGMGLDAQARVWLSRVDGWELYSQQVEGTTDNTMLACVFDLSQLSPSALTLRIQNADGTVAVSPVPFTIENAEQPKLWVEIIGRTVIRTGRPARFTLRYGNESNVEVRYPWLVIGLPALVPYTVNVPRALFPSEPTRPRTADATYITLLDLPPLPPDTYRTLDIVVTPTSDGPLTIRAQITSNPDPYFDSLLKLSDLIPRSQGEGSVSQFASALGTDKQFDDPMNPPPGYVLLWHYPEGYPNGLRWHIAKSVGDSDGNGRAEIFEMNAFRVLEGAPSDIRNHELTPSDLVNLVGGKPLRPPGWTPEHGVQVKQIADYINREYGDPSKNLYRDGLCTFGIEEGVLKANCLGLFHILNPEFRDLGQKYFKQIEDYLQPKSLLDKVLDQLFNPISKYDGTFNKTDEQCGKGLEELEKADQLIAAAVSSLSPEDKYGPSGFDAAGTGQRRRFVSIARELPYRIDFWNREDAPAPTQDVIITDQLDTDLDWRTLSFAGFGFLKWRVALEGGPYFNVDVDLRPDMNLIVNVEGRFDRDSGAIRWEFHALDPATRQPPEDPMAGFLPPITDSGYEIGWVNFSVSPKAGLPTGTRIENQAFVKFDVDVFKPAPADGPFLNTIDAGAPTSSIGSLPAQQTCFGINLNWFGSDDAGGSGIRGYTI